MGTSIIDKYVSKREKDLLVYAKILESIITIENNELWHTKKEFSDYAKEIIKIYVNDNYFGNNLNYSNPISYCNDNINNILKAIIASFKNMGKMEHIKTKRNEVFLLSIILCSSSYLDIASNPVNGDIKKTKVNFKYLLNYYKKTKILNVKDNKYLINDLFTEVNKNYKEDSRLFRDIESNDCYNKYTLKDNVIEVDFVYNIEGLDEYNELLKDKVLKEYSNEFFKISSELLQIDILKKLISGEEIIPYVINASKEIRNSNLKVFSSKYLKEYVTIKKMED